MYKFFILIATALLLNGCGPSDTADTDSGDAPAKIRNALADMGNITQVRETEWAGIYEVVINGQLLYASPDGEHFIAGELYRSQGLVNLSDSQRDGLRKQALANLEDEDSIVYSPEGETEHAVWVFTDVDCPYCQRFHADIEKYTALGIEVRYLAFPRAGKGSPSWRLTEAVWCAEDRKSALTQAKSDQPYNPDKTCEDSNNAVAHGYAAGRDVGLRGTPMIIDSTGRSMGGYLAPAELLERLNTES